MFSIFLLTWVPIRDAVRREFISKGFINERELNENTLFPIFDGTNYSFAIIFIESSISYAIIYSDRFVYIINLNSKDFTHMSKIMAFRP